MNKREWLIEEKLRKRNEEREKKKRWGGGVGRQTALSYGEVGGRNMEW